VRTNIRIGVDGRMLGPKPKGIAKYICGLCTALDMLLPEAEFFVYTRRRVALPVGSTRWHLRIDESFVGRRLPNTLWLALAAGFGSRADNLDVFWGGTGLLPIFGLRSSAVLTVHDLVYRITPETCSRRALWSARLFFHASLARADAVVTNSDGTAQRLEQNFGCSVAAVVRPGLSPLFRPTPECEIGAIRRRLGLSRPYLLSVATREPRKNLSLLIKTFAQMKKEGLLTSHDLVLAGDRGWKDEAIRTAVAEVRHSVHDIGYVAEDQLPALYSGSDIFVFPSKYEGFGMPVLEARACGTRIVTTDSTELREAGGQDAVYITPTEEGLRHGILKALALPRPRGLPLRNHSWAKSAFALAEVFQRLAQMNDDTNHSASAKIY
jgi:glycosyltransferase involved in cell wall biosynthesis